MKLALIIILALFLTVGLFGLGAIVYHIFITTRIQTPESLLPTGLYTELSKTEYSIPLEDDINLFGVLYKKGDDEKKGIVVLCHGLGIGGYISYIDVIDELASNCYEVFAFDAMGCDNSGGKGCGGFTQGVKNLDAVISYIENQTEFKNKPILLWGHSWGAWSVLAEGYYHPEVKGIVALSGYNDGMQPLKSNGALGIIFGGYVSLYNRMIFGKVANITAIDGLKATNAPVFIAHGSKDSFISQKVGYNLFYDEFKDNPRFTFMLLENRGHLDIYSDDKTSKYRENFEKGMSNTDLSTVDVKKYYGANSELMHKIIDFYDNALK